VKNRYMIADYKILGTTYFWKALYIPKMGWYPARVHPFSSGNGKRDVHIIYCVVPTLLYFTYFSASGKKLSVLQSRIQRAMVHWKNTAPDNELG